MMSGKGVGRVRQIVWEMHLPVVGGAVPVAYRGASVPGHSDSFGPPFL